MEVKHFCSADGARQLKNNSQYGNTKHKWRTMEWNNVALFLVFGLLQLCVSVECQNVEFPTTFSYATDNFPSSRQFPDVTELPGGTITDGQIVWRLNKSPYLVREDLIIEKDGELLIEAGVEVRFGPMVGITVRGILTAVGNEQSRIVLTSAEPPEHPAKEVPDLRLVDGPSILAGRVQLLHKGEWRSVCTNSRNWTRHDMETACRQLGFHGGEFFNWVDRIPGRKPRLLYEEPKCKGTETEITQCNWNSRQLGSGVCDYHPDLGIQCLPIHENGNRIQTTKYWRGIRFEKAQFERILTLSNTLYVPTSMSRLTNIVIKYAGVGRNNNATGALDVIGVPPVVKDLEITNSAYNGINITTPNAPVSIINCTIRNNRGYGIYINSSYGLSHLDNCVINENGGDGVKYVVHEINPNEKHDRTDIYDFCTLPTTASQTFPIQMSIEQSKYSNSERDCHKYFYTRPGHVLTLHFIKLLTDRNESSVISVYDGGSINDKLLATFKLKNNTRPQTITTTRNKIFIEYKAETKTEIVGFLRLTSGLSKTYDLNVSNSAIADNNGRGIAIENLRSQVHVHKSSISNNNHVAGLHVVSGVGDVNVTHSRISFNRGDGINITYSGGNRNVSFTTLSSNLGNGMAVWLNDSRETEYIHFNQSTVVQYSEIFKNLQIGILHGNYCGDSWVNVTSNWFNNSLEDAVEISTCWRNDQNNHLLNLQIGHNKFIQSQKLSIKIHPALNVNGRIEYNHFEGGRYGGIFIKNQIENRVYDEFDPLPVNILIQHNHFYFNRGVFVVNLGLSPYSHNQNILFTRNFLKENRIREPFETPDKPTSSLTPRSRVAATVVVSSSNVEIFRNILHNSESNYEIGSHLEDQSKIINCTFNWLGFSEESKIFERIFHRKDRYNLAKIEYLPYLLHNSNPAATQINYNPMFVPQFYIQGSNTVGGEVDGTEVLKPGEYTVERDINIRPGGKLILQPGVKLNFPPAIGIMIAGKLDARGNSPKDITFTLKQELQMVNNDTYETDTEKYDTETPIIEIEPLVPIRLLGGKTSNEGRLQVRINTNWGTVCNYKWNIINAALVCHQLGLVLNPDDWFMERNQIPNAGTSESIILSNVECTEFDNDITLCKSEHVEEFENSCTHDLDVGVKCYDLSWAGLRFGVLAERSDLQFINIEKAGLLDYATNIFKPALQIDFARHSLESVRVSDNLQDGLGILYSDLYGADAINIVKNSEFSNNKGNGISFKQLGLKIYGSTIENNYLAGINHDQHISGMQQRELAGWFNMAPDFNIADSNYHPIIFPEYATDISLENGETRYIVTSKLLGAPNKKVYNVKCHPGYVIGIQLLNPIHNYSTERICIYDSPNMNYASDEWCLMRDLSVFPTTSSSYGIVIDYDSGNNALGGVVLIVSAVNAPIQDVKRKIVKGAIPMLTITSTKIKGNAQGVKSSYYNRYLNEIGDHFLRKANETIKIINCEISHNLGEAVFIHTPFWDIHESNMSEITIMINNTLITDNGRGILQFARDLRSSNNLYHYILQDNSVERNHRGGFEISLPYVWQYNENFTHSVYMNNNTWRNNEIYEFIVDGHYASVNITDNIFSDNVCKNGLISIRGMEKQMKIKRNKLERNNGRFIIEFKADSQSEIVGEVKATFAYNEIKYNKFLAGFRKGFLQTTGEPTFVVGFSGIQKVRVNRNLFSNNALDYNLVAGIKTAKINNQLDVSENWWGYNDETLIKKGIFDFDDWNNHAVANFRPYLTEDSLQSSLSVSFDEPTKPDLEDLGGRLLENVILHRKDTSYIIKSDITVMPGVTLTISPGVVMEFMSNVGILVLGTLNAQGVKGYEIQMRPFSGGLENNHKERRNAQNYHRYEKAEKLKRHLEELTALDSIRLCTGRNCSINDHLINQTNEGFLEYYNRTTLQWVPMCDHRFTERNAQVVCKELGFDPINVYFDYDRRIEFHSNSLSRVWSWPEPLQCKGTEDHYEDCPIRLNGQLYGHRHECKWDSDFVFIHCGVRNMDASKNYWGGVRFAHKDFEYNLYEHRIHDIHTHETVRKIESIMEYVNITGAGILHNEKSPAVQSILKSPRINFVNISQSASHGINLISPSDTINLMFNEVHDSLGVGMSIVSLTGEGRESDESSFSPLKSLNLPYHLFSVIDICDTTKEITIEERVLIYFKYDNNPVNCVKIFNSQYRVKPFGFRLIQFNLFNHTQTYGKRDSITLYDGDIYNVSAPIITHLENGSPNEKKLFKTTGPSLSIRLFANGASAKHGFFAEVVTLPISAIGFNRDVQHNISQSTFNRNNEGALSYYSAGEVNPIITVEKNQFTDNCNKLYGNFTTCESSIDMDIQNTQTFYFRGNLVQNNVGGLSLRADSRGSATSLKGWIHNNLFFENQHLPALKIEGRQSSPYQEVIIYRNYFTRNRTPFKDVIVLRQVVSNFTMNYVHENTGLRILQVSGFDRVRLPIYQTTSHNGFYKNYALDREGRATVVAGTAGQHYVDNIFFNPDNDYEMITVNQSLYLGSFVFFRNYALDREGRATVVAGTAGQHYVDNIFFNPDNDYEMITVNQSLYLGSFVFFRNYALDREGRATVVAGTAGQHYVDNIFFNPDNDYEMITVNQSLYLGSFVFFRNYALDREGRATVVAGTAGQHYVDNIFFNPDNDYEMITVNQSLYLGSFVFFRNYALDREGRATVVAGTAGQHYVDNIFFNPDNDYEMITVNQSLYLRSFVFFRNYALDREGRATVVAGTAGQHYVDNIFFNPDNDYEMITVNQSLYLGSFVFFRNYALDREGRATVVAGTAGQHYVDNIFFNPDNDYEMITVNRSLYLGSFVFFRNYALDREGRATVVAGTAGQHYVDNIFFNPDNDYEMITVNQSLYLGSFVFFRNYALDREGRATVVAGTAGQHYVDNIFFNPDNDYEMITVNQSLYLRSFVFFRNYALDREGRATVVAGTAGQHYVDNIFFNPDNDYEMITVNQSLYLRSFVFFRNYALDREGRATVVAGTAGQHYVDNIFFNPDNDYEMITVNQSLYLGSFVFFRNYALDREGRATVVAGTAGQHYVDNIFFNPDNDYEMITVNQSLYLGSFVFFRNYALDREGRATVVAGTAGQHYVDNIFFNPDNDYEMITVNQSLYLGSFVFFRNYALDREGRATVVAGTAGQHYVDNIFFNPDNDYEMITVNQSLYLGSFVFFRNYALDREGRATVVAGTAGQHYVDNIFFNPDNDYEMITVNQSFNLDLWRTRIDAAHNYWGYNETWAVSGRIRDRSDDSELLEVNFRPFYLNNKTVLNGKCPPGWDLVGDTCYIYVGAPMTFDQARRFCSSDNASLPYISSNYVSLFQFLRKQNQWHQYSDKVWIQHIDYITQCTVFVYQSIEIDQCDQKNTFVCEIDPKVLIDPLSWKDDVVTVAVIGVFSLALLFVLAAIICWYSKSKHRHVERLQRRNSIRQSMHSVRSMASVNGGFSDLSYRRKGPMSGRSTDTLTLTKSSDYKKMMSSTASVDSVEKSQFNSSLEDNQSYDIYEAHNPNPMLLPKQQSTFNKKESPKYSSPIINMNPAFDLSFKNEGFRDVSTLPSHNPSVNTLLTEETPIIHHREGASTSNNNHYSEDERLTPHSDFQYYNSDTLPLRGHMGKSDDTLDLKKEVEHDNKYGQYGAPMFGEQPKLSFLKELKHRIPEPPAIVSAPQSSFGQRKNIAGNSFYEDNLPSPPHPPHYESLHPSPHSTGGHSPDPGHRSHGYSPEDNALRGMPKSRSKSEALLETNFDVEDLEDDMDLPHPMTEASRNKSKSQPLETAM